MDGKRVNQALTVGNRVRVYDSGYVLPRMPCRIPPGFTRCSDCGRRFGLRKFPKQDYPVYGSEAWLGDDVFPTLRKHLPEEGAERFRWWDLVQNTTLAVGRGLQSSSIPWNWVVILIGGGFLIWWTGKHHLSRWQFLGVLSGRVAAIPPFWRTGRRGKSK